MKISSYQTQIVQLPNDRDVLGEIPGRVDPTFVTLRVRTDDGVEGISYAGYAGYTAGMSVALKATVLAKMPGVAIPWTKRQNTIAATESAPAQAIAATRYSPSPTRSTGFLPKRSM